LRKAGCTRNHFRNNIFQLSHVLFPHAEISEIRRKRMRKSLSRVVLVVFFNNKTSVVFQRQLRQLKTTFLFFSAYFWDFCVR
jgi:hypothetical protein